MDLCKLTERQRAEQERGAMEAIRTTPAATFPVTNEAAFRFNLKYQGVRPLSSRSVMETNVPAKKRSFGLFK